VPDGVFQKGAIMKHANPRVAVYLRVSTSEQNFSSQEKAVKDYCNRRGWKKPIVYREKISGVKKTRPVFEEMMRQIRARQIDVVVAYKMDRLGRSMAHLVLFLEEMDRLKVSVVFTSQGIETDSETAMGRMQRHLLAMFADFERTLITERTREGMKAAKARGARLGRPATARRHQADADALCAAGVGVRESARRLGISPASVTRLLGSAERRRTDAGARGAAATRRSD
jgi:DNA invertase Pin-like site-specific DNA recombinase